MDNNKVNKRVLLIGLDGATFDIITPLIKQGKLKNIAQLMSNGSYGVLNSTIPIISPVAWTTMITGVKPGKHNIFDFVHKVPGEYQFKIAKGGDRGVKPIWEILSDRGYKVGSINVTMSYPPEKVNGFVISGIDAPGKESNYTYPPELLDELNKTIGEYHISNPYAFVSMEKHIEGMYKLIDIRTEAALYLSKQYDVDFLMIAYIETDGAQHYFWKYFDPTHPDYNKKEADKYGNVIYSIYERIDESIGKLINAFGENTTVAITSDHGFGQLQKVFLLNNWLEKEGYLKINRPPQNIFSTINKLKFLSKKAIKSLLPESILTKLAKKKTRFQEISFLNRVDWEHTTAFCDSTCGSIFINLKGREKTGTVKLEQYNSLCDEIVEKLKNFKDPETGKNPIKNVYKKESVFNGRYIENAPDIVLIDNPGYLSSGNIYRLPMKNLGNVSIANKDLFRKHQWSGNHLNNGIFIINSNDMVKKDFNFQETDIANVTPTLLHTMKESIPSAMDGQVVKEVFENSFLNDNPIQLNNDTIYTDSKDVNVSDEEEEEVKARLRDLGYME